VTNLEVTSTNSGPNYWSDLTWTRLGRSDENTKLHEEEKELTLSVSSFSL
jgi:hypothetical protein